MREIFKYGSVRGIEVLHIINEKLNYKKEKYIMPTRQNIELHIKDQIIKPKQFIYLKII